jgi:membrane-associated phospholipid phosphatase
MPRGSPGTAALKRSSRGSHATISTLFELWRGRARRVSRDLQPRKLVALLLSAAICTAATAASAEPVSSEATSLPAPTAAPDSQSGNDQPSTPPVLSDIGAYFTAPLRWDGHDWAWFGGAVLAVGLAHRYDGQVRSHFVGPGPANVNSEDTNDAIPTAAVLGGTWALAILTNNHDGYQEGWAMIEATGLSTVTAYALKFAAGRETPDQTTNPNEWEKSGSSFPSFHSTAAFAVGTVLAESGNDEYRWLRRLLGYGLGVATSYERLKHNAHWLSDTVAGAALGMSSAHFVMDRRYGINEESHLALVPVQGGAMLTYKVTLP